MRLVWFGSFWLAGIWFGSIAHLNTMEWLVLALLALASAVWLRQRPRFRILYLMTMILCLGGARYQSNQSLVRPDHIAWYNDTGDFATITGIVAKPPEVRESYVGLKIETEAIRFRTPGKSIEVSGMILARSTRFKDWRYGDRVVVRGYLETPPEYEAFSYRAYLERQGIYGLVGFAGITRIASDKGNPFLGWIYALRRKALSAIQHLFPDPEASLVSGILIGDELGIPPEIREAFDQTSTSHVIAISGFNITIITSVLLRFFRRWLGARRGMLLAGLGVAIYTAFVGADAAVVRAAFMGALTLIALRTGRQTTGLASLAAAAIAMTALDPDVLWDVGFQLSFTATLGLMLYTPPLEKAFLHLAGKTFNFELAKRWVKPVSEFVLVTLAAQIVTLPLTVLYFQRLPIVSLLANPIILPLQPALMTLTGLATILGLIFHPLGQLVAWIAWPFPALTIRFVTTFAALPISSLPTGRFSPMIVVIFYILLFSMTVYTSLPEEKRPQIKRPAIQPIGYLAPMAILTLLLWRVAADQPDGLLHITVFDVGEGDATLIQTPTGRYLLINGGPSTIRLSEELGSRLPLFNRQLDWVLISGTRESQLGGLVDTLERFPPSNVLSSGPARSGGYGYLLEQLTELGIPIQNAENGQELSLGNGTSLGVGMVNNNGAVFRLRYGEFRFLHSSGADPEMIQRFVEGGAFSNFTAVLLPAGGSETVNSPEWLGGLQTQLVLISVDSGTSRNLPSDNVLEALQRFTVLRTDVNGWIELTTDGTQLWVEVERLPVEPR